MNQITRKTAVTIPDLVADQQDVRQVSSSPLTWRLTGFTKADASNLITYIVTLTYENFTSGNAYEFVGSFVPQTAANTFDGALTGATTKYFRFTIELDGVVIYDKYVNDTTTAGLNLLVGIVQFRVGSMIKNAKPTIKFTVSHPRPTATAPYPFDALLALTVN